MNRLIIGSLIVAFAAPAVAEPKRDAAAAEALFERGRELLEAGKTEEACEKFEASQRADAAVGTLLNLGACYEKLGRSATAWARFREAQAMAEGLGDAARQKLAGDRADALESQLARVRIELQPSAQIDDLVVSRDAVVIEPGALGTALPVDPGEYTITARAPGYEPFRAQITASRAETTVVPIALRRVEREARDHVIPDAGARERSTRGSHWRKPVGIVLLGAGAVSAGVGGYFGLRARARWNDASKECPNDQDCTPSGVSLGNKAGRDADRSTWLIAGGAVAASAGLFLWLTAPAEEDGAPARTVTVAPAFGSFAGVFIEGRL